MTTQRNQTIAPLSVEVLRLAGLSGIRSPYSSVRDITLRTLYMAHRLYITDITYDINTSDDSTAVLNFAIYSTSFGVGSGPFTFSFPKTGREIKQELRAYLVAFALSAWSATVSPDDIIFNSLEDDTLDSIIASGVAKERVYTITATPTVAGGAGVARFYIDSNGDGSGTAPSEVYASSLQATVWDTSLGYVQQSYTVGGSGKYIDVKMGTLSFSGLTILGQTVLGSQSIANAANGTAVNCFVLVKK